MASNRLRKMAADYLQKSVQEKCACNRSLYSAVGMKLECLPQKFALAKPEAKELFSKLARGDVTMGELSQGVKAGVELSAIFVFSAFFSAGICGKL